MFYRISTDALTSQQIELEHPYIYFIGFFLSTDILYCYVKTRNKNASTVVWVLFTLSRKSYSNE